MPSHDRPLRILLLHDEVSRVVGTVNSHVEGLIRFSRHDVVECDASYIQRYKLDLGLFDVIVFHYSLIISSDAYLEEEFIAELSAARASKILFIQDEYRWVDRTAAAAEAVGVDCIFTVVNDDVVRKIYHHKFFDGVRFETTLTGFVPEELTKKTVPEFIDRPIDVGYRARKLPAWLGEFGQQKWMIGERFNQDAQRYDLKCDISSSESDRIYGDNWIRFVAETKAMLGTESGASFIDFTGEVQPAVEAYEERHPKAPFHELQKQFLEGRDGEITIHVISPRCFEAAALRTLMIMYPGDYSGILKPDRHYVPLNTDHSNMSEVVTVLRDPNKAMPIIDRAFREIACSEKWTFATFVGYFDDVANDLCRRADREARSRDTQAQLPRANFERVIDDWSSRKEGWRKTRRRKITIAIQLKKVSDHTMALVQRVLPERWRDPITYRLNQYKRRAGLFLMKVVFGRE